MKPSELRLDPPLSRPHGGAYQMELDGRGLLTLFLALAVVCGMFFAFGYTIGKHAVPANFTLGSAQTSASNAAPGAGPTVPPGVQPPNPKDLSSAEANQTPSTLTPDASTSAAAAAAPNSTATNSTVAGPPVGLFLGSAIVLPQLHRCASGPAGVGSRCRCFACECRVLPPGC